MDLVKIEQLTNTLKSALDLKFEVSDDREIRLKNNYHKMPSKVAALEFVGKLQAAIGPIVEEYRSELRKQLALCAKFKE